MLIFVYCGLLKKSGATFWILARGALVLGDYKIVTIFANFSIDFLCLWLFSSNNSFSTWKKLEKKKENKEKQMNWKWNCVKWVCFHSNHPIFLHKMQNSVHFHHFFVWVFLMIIEKWSNHHLFLHHVDDQRDLSKKRKRKKNMEKNKKKKKQNKLKVFPSCIFHAERLLQKNLESPFP